MTLSNYSFGQNNCDVTVDIIDLWTGYGFSEFKSKDEIVKYIKEKRKIEFGLYNGISF